MRCSCNAFSLKSGNPSFATARGGHLWLIALARFSYHSQSPRCKARGLRLAGHYTSHSRRYIQKAKDIHGKRVAVAKYPWFGNCWTRATRWTVGYRWIPACFLFGPRRWIRRFLSPGKRAAQCPVARYSEASLPDQPSARLHGWLLGLWVDVFCRSHEFS